MWNPQKMRACPPTGLTLLLLTVALNTTAHSDELKRTESPQTMVLSEDGGWGYAGRHAQVAQNRLFYSYLDQEGISWVASLDFETGQITQTPLGQGNNDLHSSNPHSVFLARSTSEADDLSQIQRMVTRDGGARWDTADVLSEECRVTTVVIPQVLDASRREVDVIWLQGRMEGWRSYATQVVARRMAVPE